MMAYNQGKMTKEMYDTYRQVRQVYWNVLQEIQPLLSNKQLALTSTEGIGLHQKYVQAKTRHRELCIQIHPAWLQTS
jgi:hypothetical protein